jgi:hypothetical protein
MTDAADLERDLFRARHRLGGGAMRFQIEYAVSALQRLERLTSRLRRRDNQPTRISEGLAAIDVMLSTLAQQVVVTDDLMRTAASEEELVFRTMRLVILTQLACLENAVRALADQPASMMREWSPAFRSAIVFGRVELARITRTWTIYRTEAHPGITDITRYNIALCTAFDEVNDMTHSPEFAEVMRHGMASAEWPEIAQSCEQILVAARARVDLDAARVFWTSRGHAPAIRAQEP